MISSDPMMAGRTRARRPWVIFPLGFWVMVAGFAQLRPLDQGVLQPPLTALAAEVLLTILFMLVIVEVIFLMRLRLLAVRIAMTICGMWTLVIAVRIFFALKYSPWMFGPGPEGFPAYVAPVIAIVFNLASLAALSRLEARSKP